MEESKLLLSQMIADMKSEATALKVENIQRIGLIKMIQNDVERMNKFSTLEIYSIDLECLPKLKAEKEVFLYRMVQKIFTTILKRSKASIATIKHHQKGQKNLLVVSDNGVGFDQTEEEPINMRFGNGLNNLKERCTIIGAELDINSKKDNGNSVTITF